ncbi:aldehyde dehydrogenase family protein [Candidatus Thalassolituus haligoni]|uniref:aldehyde dehydrogenase family protein n=1 Tax=Candidatus Thalassolituus haligoni TaxID=3100113 RepID=UPI003519A18E
MSMLNSPSMLINGRLVRHEQMMDVINPANERVICQVPFATSTDAIQAIAAAKAAYPQWRNVSLEVRKNVLLNIADIIEQNSQELRQLITLEQGKPLAGSDMELMMSATVLRYFASLKLAPEVIRNDDSQRVELHRRPLGIVAAIIPWNFPVLMAVYKLAPALLAGNTLVIKPSPTTPLATLRLGELLQSVVPAGVINVLADRGDIGPLLSQSTDVAKISFTGSTQTGRQVMASSAHNLKRLTLELGGNDAAIVLDDVNVEQVAEQIFDMAFINSGQVCMSIKRIYVQEGVYDAMCAALAKRVADSVTGDGMDPATQFGPVQNRKQFDDIRNVLSLVPQYGRILAGGKIRTPGFFIEPTLVCDTDETSPIANEEIFGPVRSIMKFNTIDEAVSRANNSQYGLGGSVWSSDVEKAAAIAGRLECGISWVNQHFAMAPDVPFGGVKQSGMGVEFSEHGLDEYTSIQSLVVAK